MGGKLQRPGPTPLGPRDPGILEALRAQSARRSAPAHEALLLLLDGSSSMIGASWRDLAAAVEALAQASTAETCLLGLALFSDGADAVCPFQAPPGAIPSRLPTRPPGGGTGMREGLGLALRLPWPEGARRRVILLSDGMPTSGDPLPAARELASAVTVLDTVGCGPADEVTLRALAAAGGGRYVFAPSARDLIRAFLALETRARGLLRSAP